MTMFCPLRQLVLRLCRRRLRGQELKTNQRGRWNPYRALPSSWFHSHTSSLNPVVRASVVSRQLSHRGNHHG